MGVIHFHEAAQTDFEFKEISAALDVGMRFVL